MIRTMSSIGDHAKNQRPFSRPTKRPFSRPTKEPGFNVGPSTELSLDFKKPRQNRVPDFSRWTAWRQAKDCTDDAVLDSVLAVIESDEMRSSSSTSGAPLNELLEGEEQSLTTVNESTSAVSKSDADNAVQNIDVAVDFTADLSAENSLEVNVHHQEQEEDYDEIEADNFSYVQKNDDKEDSLSFGSSAYEEQEEYLKDKEADNFLDFQENGAFDKDYVEDRDGHGLSQECDKPLYFGSAISVMESIVSILVFFLRHSLTTACLTDLLTLINLHCPKPNFCKKSVYLFKKFLAFQQPIVTTYFCNSCYTLCEHSFSICSECKMEQRKDCNFITQMSATKQLKTILERPGLLQSISKKKCKHGSNSGEICDLYDGTVYKKFQEQELSGTCVTFMWFTDGAALFKSSNISLWPLYLAINELPFNERFQPENLILAALWVGEKKPEMNIFFKCCDLFLTEVEKGIEVVADGLKHLIKGKILCGTCDLPAKCSVLNMTQFNGSYGCAKCLQKGETFFYAKQNSNVHRGKVHVYPFQDTIDKPKRNHDDTISHAKKAYESKKIVYGIKGPSQLCLYVNDIIKSTGIDYMHGVCLGVMRKVLTLFLDSNYSKYDFSVSKFRIVMDKNLLSITVPHMLQRAPRSVSLLKQWKASELKNFLLYYSIPVFRPIVKKKYLEHHMLLVDALSKMLKKDISKSELHLAEQALWQYVYLFEKHFGRQHMSANVHNLLHLADNVRDLGPLWVSSCFSWESVNGSLLKYVHGTQYVQTQINAAVSIQLSLPAWIKRMANPEVKLFCEKMQKSARYRTSDILSEDTYVVGSMRNCTEQETNQLMLLLGDTFKNSKVFHRMVIRKLLFTSYAYSKTHKKKSCYVKCRDSNGLLFFGCIDYFVKLSVCSCENFDNLHCFCAPNYYCVVNKYICNKHLSTTELEKNISLSHILEITTSTEYALISCEQLLFSCVFYNCIESGKMYISEMVNLIEFE